MYFATGIARCASLRQDVEVPQRPSALSEESLNPPSSCAETASADPEIEITPLVAAQQSPDARAFAVITPEALSLWSCKPTALIAKSFRSEDDVRDHGTNSQLFWKQDSSVIAVITSIGHILLYELRMTEDVSLYTLIFEKQRNYILGAGEAHGLPEISLVYKARLRIDGDVTSGTYAEDALILCAKSERTTAIHALQITDNSVSCDTHELVNISFVQPYSPEEIIQAIEYVAELDGFVWLMSSGRVFIAHRLSRGGRQADDGEDDQNTADEDSSITWIGRCIAEGPYVTFAINPRLKAIAIGRSDGGYELHSYDTVAAGSEGNQLAPTRIEVATELISLVPSAAAGTVGAMARMVWSHDGCAMAIAFREGGLVVYSPFGRPLLIATRDKPSMSEGDEILGEFLNGVDQVFWGEGAFNLFLFPSAAKQMDSCRQYMFILPFVHSVATLQQSACSMVEPLLLGSTGCILLSESIAEGGDGPVRHKQIRYPTMYLAENWPITRVAMSETGRELALVGRHGFALYSRDTGRYKLFGDRAQEQSFSCRGIAFIHGNLFVLGEFPTGGHRLWMFDTRRSLNLDDALDYAEVFVTPTFFFGESGSVFLGLVSGAVVTYRLSSDQQSMEQDPQWHIPDVIHPGSVSYVRKLRDTKLRYLILAGGTTYIWEPAAEALTQILDQTEYVLSCSRIVNAVSDFYWLITRDKCHVFCGLKEVFSFPLHSVAMALLPAHGNIITLSQQVTARANMGFVTFDIMSNVRVTCSLIVVGHGLLMDFETSVFIHHVIEYLLRKDLPAIAHQYAHRFSDLVYFNEALEMLLHHAWERDLEHGVAKEARLLPRVVEFLKHYDDYLDAIVKCVRKTEITLWGYLFDIVGSPKVIFEECLNNNRLHTATSLLVILHNVETPYLSGQDSIRLMERVLESEDFELSRDLVQFLRRIGGKGAGRKLWDAINDNRDQAAMYIHRSNSSPMSISMLQREGALAYLEMAITRHARKLLAESRLRSLYLLSCALNMPLSTWLRKERERGANVEDISSALQRLHEQFNWPYPEIAVGGQHQIRTIQRRHTISMGWQTVDPDADSRGASSPSSPPQLPVEGLQEEVAGGDPEYGPPAPKSPPRQLSGPISADSAPWTPSAGRQRSITASSQSMYQSPERKSPVTRRARRALSMAETKLWSCADADKDANEIAIRALARAMVEAEWWAWAVLLQCLLCDATELVTLISDHNLFSIWATVSDALVRTSVSGYESLVAAIAWQLRQPQPELWTENEADDGDRNV